MLQEVGFRSEKDFCLTEDIISLEQLSVLEMALNMKWLVVISSSSSNNSSSSNRHSSSSSSSDNIE